LPSLFLSLSSAVMAAHTVFNNGSSMPSAATH
jgi:hypothetical protein